MIFNILLKIFIISTLIIFATSSLFVYSNTHPPRYPHHIPPSQYNLDYEEVDFEATDAIVLKGWFVKAKADNDFHKKKYPVIIISHGLGASKSDFTDFSSKLVERGYHVFLFDFRGHGESKGRRTSLGYQEQRDLLAAIDYIKKREDVIKEKIGLYGFSMGAAVSILTAAKHKNVQVIVSDSSYTSLKEEGEHVLRSFYRLPAFPFEYFMTWAYNLFFMTDVEKISPLDNIAALSPIPVFIIGGEKDEMMPASFAKRLFKNAKDPKSLWIIPGARHGETLYRAGDDYPKRVGSFFDQYLKEKH
jgi:uncharacterized protein